MSARFGVAGNSDTFTRTVSRASADAPAWLRSIGLDCYEYQCGQGVRVGEATARTIGANAARAGIALSLHAPYFINLSNPAPEALARNTGHVLAACRAAQWMGAARVVVHAGALMGRGRAEALETAKASLREILRAVRAAGYGEIALCPETMGKINQLGDLEEVLALCRMDEALIPCVDFGHLYARSLGALDGAEAFSAMLDRMEDVLGAARARRFHSHFSKIEFTPRGGEKRHLRFADPGWGPDFRPLAAEVVRRGWEPVFICESAGTQSEDALEMRRIYDSCKGEE
ncbi:MAG TPA: TIM barrel protein [Candidatus Onthomonas avicola]|nr:TIM barrel protein [Candidatus Onthomonas avicola]